MIKFENVSCGYGEHTLFRDLSFTARAGEITAVSAPSGVGKTTLLKAINRLHEIDESDFWHRGNIMAVLDSKEHDLYGDSIDIYLLRRKIAYIFQSPTALPMSIEENVAFGLKLAGERDKETVSSKVRDALDQTGLWDEVSGRLSQSAEKLSLGQMQRLSIARALVLEPEIILFDEPTSSLDDVATQKIEMLMRLLKMQHTIILVSHDNGQISRVADKYIEIATK